MDIGTILIQWQSAGVFEYVLPFLLIFAIVFGILESSKLITQNRKIHVIIALVIGLLSVGYTSRMNFSLGQFLGEILPRLGVGLTVLLVVLILIGLFIPADAKDQTRKYWFWGLAALGLIIAVVTVSKSFDTFGWYSTGGYENYLGWIVGAILLIGIIIAVAVGGSNDSSKPKGS